MKRLILLLVFNCSVSVGFGQQIKWERKWLGNQPQAFIAAIDKNQDTSIVVSGGTYEFNSGPFRALFMKYDKNGNQLWQKYGRIMRSGEQDIITYGNQYLFAGTQRVQDAANIYNQSDIGLHWLNSNGDSLQNNRYGVPQNVDNAIKILAANNDIFVLANSGVNRTNATGVSLDYSLLKLSNNGTMQQWFKTYGGNNTEYASCLIRNSRGNLVISGISQGRTTITPYRPYLIEITTNGDTIRTKQLIIKGSTYWVFTGRFFHNIAETSDGNYIMSGGIDTNSPNVKENFIAKLDANFNVLWVYYDAILTSYYGFSKVQQLSDGNYVVLMHGDAALPGDYHIVKVSATGQFISRTTYNSPITGHVLTYDWEFLGDGSVVIAGKTSANEAYIARLGNVGVPAVVSSVADPIAKAKLLIQLYPNPAGGHATFSISGYTGKDLLTVDLLDVLGRKLEVPVKQLQQEAAQQLEVNTAALPAGLYLYRLYSGNTVLGSGKLVKE